MIMDKRGHKIIGIVCAGITDTGIQNTVLKLISEAERRGCKTFVISNFTYYDKEYLPAERDIFNLIGAPVFDGLLLMPESIKSDTLWQLVLEKARATGLPFVCVDRDVPGCTSITYDYGRAFEQVVRHIVEVHKPRRINFIGGIKDNSFSEERLDVFKKVLADNGRTFEPERFGYGQFWELPTIQVMDDFRNSGLEPPDAIICVNDAEAMTVCSYLRNLGTDVPNDIIVSGFDGIEEEKYTVPRLTTAACDIEGMCSKAFDMLEIKEKGGEVPQLTVIPYKLRISQSCGCKPINEGDKADKLLELFLERKDSERHERSMFGYSAKTSELENYSDFAELMSTYVEFPTWCCIDPKILSGDDADTPELDRPDDGMFKLLTYSGDVNDNNIGDRDFYKSEILPDIEEVLDKNNALLFVPLSFQGESMGYLAASMDSENFSFLYTLRYVSNTNQIFETLKTRIRMQNAYAKVADMHMRDAMTGIYNRRGFYLKMAELTESGTMNFRLFSIDLDRLKLINDTFGHSAGDKAIISAAKVIKDAAGDEAVCARFGGDEFIVVIPESERSDTYIDRVNTCVEEFNSAREEKYKLGVSIGDAFLKITDRENIDTAMKAADRKMYECKRRHHANR